jgi:hypothetical protein
MANGTRTVDIVVCDKHGLRYNRAVESGCVRCRRGESGVQTGVVATATATAAATATAPVARADRPASTAIQLVLAAVLIGGTGSLFFSAHHALLESFAGGAFAAAGKAGRKAAAGRHGASPSSETAPEREQPPTIWPSPEAIAEETPAVDPKGHGPAEEQKQLDEFFRQMREEEAKASPAQPAAAKSPPPR